MNAKKLFIAYIGLVLIVGASLLQSCQSRPAHAAQIECDMEAADQAWQHTYGNMNETELAAGMVLEPTGEAK